jgi:anaerobic ribonucleoside-triphosphate reductase activating protein
MIVYDATVTFSELAPVGLISYTLFVHGCPNKCKNCSWLDLEKQPFDLSIKDYQSKLSYFKGKCDAVTMLGGEWNKELSEWLGMAKKENYVTCLYTGRELEDIDKEILTKLDYIKVGKWLGKTLYDKETNQKFYKLKNGKVIGDIKFYG